MTWTELPPLAHLTKRTREARIFFRFLGHQLKKTFHSSNFGRICLLVTYAIYLFTRARWTFRLTLDFTRDYDLSVDETLTCDNFSLNYNGRQNAQRLTKAMHHCFYLIIFKGEKQRCIARRYGQGQIKLRFTNDL